jgi:hypothetical protein
MEDDDVIGLGSGTGLDQLTAIAQDVDSIAHYGKRIGIYENAVQTHASDLADATTAHLNEYKSPKRYIRIRVIDTPTHPCPSGGGDGEWDLEPGDTIRLRSPLGRGRGGSAECNLDDNFRIYKAVRHFSSQGYEMELTLTNPYPRGKSFIQEYLEQQQELAVSTDSALKNYDGSDLWTDWIAQDNTLWQSLTIQLGFTPTAGHIVALQVLEYETGYYTHPETQIDYRVKDLRTGEMEIEYRRTEVGLHPIRIHFLWKAWSRRRTFSSIGVGGQIS